jgi:hypothetical protein
MDDVPWEFGLWEVISALGIDPGRITSYVGIIVAGVLSGLFRQVLWCTIVCE